MSEQVIVLSNSSSSRVRRGFFHISLIARVQWGVEGEYFYIWLDESNMNRVRSFIHLFCLAETKVNGDIKEKGDSEAAQELFLVAPSRVRRENCD